MMRKLEKTKLTKTDLWITDLNLLKKIINKK